MERRGITSVGNWICDIVKFIDSYPVCGNLVTIRRSEKGFGGCAHNVLLDLAALKTDMPLYAGGCIGNDLLGKEILQELKDNNIDSKNMIMVDAPTSYTDVMSEIKGEATRTFFHNAGANALLSREHIDLIDNNSKIVHFGYLLLLEKMDAPDVKYGTMAARSLHNMQQKGFKTSIDVVSEISERFPKIVLPALPYTNYFIINEIEAGACLETNLREADGSINIAKIEDSASKILAFGVQDMCIIHFPEGGFAMTKDGIKCFVPSKEVPYSEIVSTVGAGDAFCAGALYAIHENYPIETMLSFANASARFNLFGATATSAAPTLKQLLNYLNN